MAGSVRSLRVNTVELLRQPGERREVVADVEVADLGVDDPRTTGAPVHVDLTAESTVDGIVVRGTLEVTWRDECRRCLRELVRTSRVEVDELYQDSVSDPEAFELGPDALDLTPMVRDSALLALADPPSLCRDDCAGICPVCGVDRNERSCSCDTTVRDERWSALDDLDLET
jgi:uncharacterized protein